MERLRFRLRRDAAQPGTGPIARLVFANTPIFIEFLLRRRRPRPRPYQAYSNKFDCCRWRFLKQTAASATWNWSVWCEASPVSKFAFRGAARRIRGFNVVSETRAMRAPSGFEIRRGYPASPRGQANRALPRLSSAQNPSRTAPPRENHRAFPDRWLDRLRPEVRRMSLAAPQEPPR